MFRTWHTMLFLTVWTSLVPMMRWAVVLDCLLLIGSFSNLLINFLVDYCSPSTSHRTPLGSETVQRFTRMLAASPDKPRPAGDHDNDHLRQRRVVVSAVATRELRRDVSVVQDTMICLWDLTEEVLKKSSAGFRRSHASNMSHSNSVTSKVNKLIN